MRDGLATKTDMCVTSTSYAWLRIRLRLPIASCGSDREWDTRILDELASFGRSLIPLKPKHCTVLSRFDGYAVRLESALTKAKSGEHEWIDTTFRGLVP